MDGATVFQEIRDEVKKHIAGKDETIELMIIAIVANGHALLEGVPGVAKTTMTKALASAVSADFKRVQGTPDLVPSDITGYTYRDEIGNVQFRRGPIFTNMLLVDELNRTQPKTMSALLETLEERQVTVGGRDFQLPKPFITFATQNPLKIEGTEPLPKVLADRFIMKIDVDYPNMKEEQEMMRLKEKEETYSIKKVIDANDVMGMQQDAKAVTLPDDVAEYITQIVDATRKEIHVVMGASPRADLAFMNCSKARAYLSGRKEVARDDIKFLAKPILSHRISVRATGGIGAHGIIDGIIASLR
jgi:MoxR-like ATPase